MPTLVHIANGISIGSAVYVGLTIVTDRQADRLTDIVRPYVKYVFYF